MKTLLFVNACLDRSASRTDRLARALIGLLRQREEYTVEELVLEDEDLRPLDAGRLHFRNGCIEKHDFSDASFRYARQLRDADLVVLAAPYWDGSFPAAFKCWLEQVCVNGLTFRYSETGTPVGLCRASRGWYVTTVGGHVYGENLGLANVQFVLSGLCGIRDCRYVDAQGLDIVGNDPEKIMQDAVADLPARL